MLAVRRWSDLARKDTLLEDLAESYRMDLVSQNKSPYTLDWYGRNLAAFACWAGNEDGGGTLEDLTPEMVRAYIVYLQKRGLSPFSVQGHVRTLKAFASWLEAEGYTEDNRLRRVRLPKLPKQQIRPLTEEEKEEILKLFNEQQELDCRNKAIVLLMLDCGLRLSEVTGLKLGDLDLTRRKIIVRGKGDKDRAVGMGLVAARTLRRYIYNRRPEAANDVAEVFVTQEGEPLKPHSLKQFFLRLAKRTGIDRLHAHLLRHTFSTDLLRRGADVFLLQEVLGHTSLEMVRRYSHLAREDIVEGHKRLSPMDFHQRLHRQGRGW